MAIGHKWLSRVSMRAARIRAWMGLCLALCGCGEQGSSAPTRIEPGASVAPAASAHAEPSEGVDEALFDRIVTAESVFPDAAVRARYRALPPVSENGMRSYAFQLVPQPGMDEARHFSLVTITWARGGRFVKSRDAAAAPAGVGGPGGGFVDAYAQTADGAYDVRVTLGMLLPASVKQPAFDIERTAANMVRLYTPRNPAS